MIQFPICQYNTTAGEVELGKACVACRMNHWIVSRRLPRPYLLETQTNAVRGCIGHGVDKALLLKRTA